MPYQNITISGKICTGKSTLRTLLAKKLGWHTFSTGELFREYVKKHGLTLEDASEQNNVLTRKIDNQVRDILRQKSHLIVDSWLAGVTAQDIPHVLKVLLVCKDTIRYKRFAKRESLPYTEAKTKVEERFANWEHKLRKIYRRNNFMDERLFDLVIDTSYITPNAVASRVLSRLSPARCKAGH